MDIPPAMKKREIHLVEEFTDSPGGRFRKQGDYSGQQFREEMLIPALDDEQTDLVVVNLDGALGLPSSFLDEAFGVTAEMHPGKIHKLRVVVTDNEVAFKIVRDCMVKHGDEKLAAETVSALGAN